eukprot:CAMPEP_0206512262 /NCGR_PEP_ID=MMETSP0324_2-20121206/60773_1 /ASSEMBLY_ACC=CAM_ASM_000836 /TAXON_ID=2866 /ORGANISM="Crypthecodinium cohnii, Strain Seligo" /LENGTH=54 /DNA_ID=CAMNT_0054004183 /DNA_START=299 /DNA_END=460 /DNA_ORIENTATION=+
MASPGAEAQFSDLFRCYRSPLYTFACGWRRDSSLVGPASSSSQLAAAVAAAAVA